MTVNKAVRTLHHDLRRLQQAKHEQKSDVKDLKKDRHELKKDGSELKRDVKEGKKLHQAEDKNRNELKRDLCATRWGTRATSRCCGCSPSSASRRHCSAA